MKTSYIIEVLKTTIALLLFFSISFTAIGQESKKIQLINNISRAPISDVYFQYTSQSGISDKNGMIDITYKEGENLLLSHLSYGRWILDDTHVKLAFQSGTIEKDLISIDLQPVSIVALHSKINETKKIDLNYQDRQQHDAGAILNFDPAISTIRKSGSYGFDPVLRGFKYDQLNIVVNGSQSASAACPNRMDPATSQVALNMIDHIEVLKGPYALRFGNGFGGTINFIPTAPEYSDKYRTYGRLSGTYESNGNIMRSEGFIGGSTKKINYKLFGSWSQGDDYKDGNGDIVPSDFLRVSIGADLAMKLRDNQQLSFSANRNFGRDTDFPALPMDLRKDDTWMVSANHEILFNNRSLNSWKTMIYETNVNHHMDNYLKVISPRTVNTESPTQTNNIGGRTEGRWAFKNSELFTGGDLRFESAEGTRIREYLTGPNAGKVFTDNSWQNSRISRSAVFIESHITTNNLVYVIAGRLEVNNAKAKDTADEFIKVNPETSITQLNPSLSLGAIKNFSEIVALKLWLGRAQRSGSLTERYINYFAVGQDPYELLGNPTIKPEINNQTDLIFEVRTEKSYINLDVFASYLQDYISSVKDPSLTPRLPNSPGVRQFQNIGAAFKTGFEISWKQSLFLGMNHQFGLAYTYGKGLKDNNPLPEIAPLDLRYSLSGRYLKNRLIPEITVRHAMAQNRISEEFGETATPSFTTLDLDVSYSLIKIIHLCAGVQNLFDVAYYEHLNRGVTGAASKHINNPGRSFFLSLNLDIK
jgi:iron complex outermembrane receptor protein